MFESKYTHSLSLLVPRPNFSYVPCGLVKNTQATWEERNISLLLHSLGTRLMVQGTSVEGCHGVSETQQKLMSVFSLQWFSGWDRTLVDSTGKRANWRIVRGCFPDWPIRFFRRGRTCDLMSWTCCSHYDASVLWECCVVGIWLQSWGRSCVGPLGKEGVGGEEMGGRRSERGKEEGGRGWGYEGMDEWWKIEKCISKL